MTHFCLISQVTFAGFKRSIRRHQAIDVCRIKNKQLPEGTPRNNQYVKGLEKIEKHTCLGSIYIPQHDLKKRRHQQGSRMEVRIKEKTTLKVHILLSAWSSALLLTKRNFFQF